MIDRKELGQARLLGRCLAGMLAINLLIVSLAFGTRTRKASAEAASQPARPSAPIASAPQVTPNPNEPTTVHKIDPPAPIQAKSANPPPKAAPLKVASAPSPSTPAEITEQTVPSPEPTKLQSPHEAPAPVEESKSAVLRLVNPSETDGVVYYAVDGESFSLSPGEYHELAPTAECVVEFHRGGDFGYAKLNLTAGDYLFAVGETGWSLSPGKISPASSLNRAN